MKLSKKPAENRAGILGLPSRKWHRVYYMLTAFNVLVVLLGLFLNRELVRIYDSSVAVNQEWVRRLDNLNELGPLIGAIDAPGNNVFDTHAVNEESSNLSEALRTFDEHMAAVEEELRFEVGRENRSKTIVPQDVEELQQDLAAIKGGGGEDGS